ncbi:MAG: hypothetical protein V1782_07980 [Pseudomonadota bacterium]
MARKESKTPDRQLPADHAANKQTVGLIFAIARDEYGEVPPRLTSLFSDVADLYAGHWPSHEACAVTYHNFSHALDVCLAAARMLSGWNKVEQAHPWTANTSSLAWPQACSTTAVISRTRVTMPVWAANLP